VTIENTDSIGIEGLQLVINDTVLAWGVGLILHASDSLFNIVFLQMGGDRSLGFILYS